MRESAQRGSNTSRAGQTGRDCKLFVLQAGVAVTPDTDDLVIYQGRTWLVSQVNEDPAGSYWSMYGVEMRTLPAGGGTDTGNTPSTGGPVGIWGLVFLPMVAEGEGVV